MLSYRGYGYSEGEPSEQGIQVDTQVLFISFELIFLFFYYFQI